MLSIRPAEAAAAIIKPAIDIPPFPGLSFRRLQSFCVEYLSRRRTNFSVGMTLSFPFRKPGGERRRQTWHGPGSRNINIDAQTRGQEQEVVVEVRNAYRTSKPRDSAFYRTACPLNA